MASIQAQFLPETAPSVIHLTIASSFRRPVFAYPEAARAVARAQRSPAVWCSSRCLAWVLMPDSWQGLVIIGAEDSLNRLARRFKAATTRTVEPRFRVNGWLWERKIAGVALANEEDQRSAARQLIGSPVRAGLADCVGSYPYWDAVWLEAAATIRPAPNDLPTRGEANTMAR